MSDLKIGTVVTAKSAGTSQVKLGAVTVTAQVARDLTVATGDQVLICPVGAQFFVIQRFWESATGVVDSSPSEPATTHTTGKTTFTPTRTISWRSSGWRTDTDAIYQGTYGGWGNHKGCAFYGKAPRSLAGATVTNAYIRAKRLSAGTYAAQTLTLMKITENAKPSGEPTFTSASASFSLAVGATDTNIDIPNSVAQAIVDGTYGGLGVYVSGGSPYVRLAGLSDYSASFALTIQWRR